MILISTDGVTDYSPFHSEGEALVVQQARQLLRRGFLMAKAARQLGLAAGLLVKNGLHIAPFWRALQSQSLDQGPARCLLASYVPRLITSPSL